MDNLKQMRIDVKKYIDNADDKVVKMMHAMLEIDADNNWWESMPDTIKADVETSLAQADKGQLIPHEEIQKKYSKWLAK